MSLNIVKLVGYILMSCAISYGIETRTRIALLDTGYPRPYHLAPVKDYLCEDKHVDLTNTFLEDDNGHSTNLIYILSKHINPKKACITVIKTYSYAARKTTYAQGIDYAMDIGAKYINMSAGGTSKMEDERREISLALLKGIHFITVSGNNGVDLGLFCDYYPACYAFKSPFFHVVGNLLDQRTRAHTSNYGGPVTNWEIGTGHCECPGLCMSGTSQAAAVFTGKLVQKELR
jgi:hypothetical protein